MTPENLSNGNPFILCIKDALGIPHQVAPLNHSHNYNEVHGLADDLSELWIAMNEKANSEAINEALEAKADITTMNNALEGKMPNMPIDNEPEADSRALVLSGGVASALAEKASKESTDVIYYNCDSILYVDELFTSGNTQATVVIENTRGEEISIDQVFQTSNDTEVLMPELEIFPADAMMVCRIIYCPEIKVPSEKYIVVMDRLIEW